MASGKGKKVSYLRDILEGGMIMGKKIAKDYQRDKEEAGMVYWTGFYWVCEKCDTTFGMICPSCGATPFNTKHAENCFCYECDVKRRKAQGERQDFNWSIRSQFYDWL